MSIEWVKGKTCAICKQRQATHVGTVSVNSRLIPYPLCWACGSLSGRMKAYENQVRASAACDQFLAATNLRPEKPVAEYPNDIA